MTIRIGGHLRAAEGLAHLVVGARALGYTLVQTMLSAERDYEPREIPEKDLQEFRKNAFGLEIYVHLPYTINPCEGDARRRNFYKRSAKAFMEAAQTVDARGCVIHAGFKKDLSANEAHKNLCKFLEEMGNWDHQPYILVENDAGSKNGSAIGTPEFIGTAIETVENPRIGMCLDTCHLYARGVDIWDQETREHILSEHGHQIKLLHLNSPDPNVTLGSFLDRHNTPFEDRPNWDHESMFRDLLVKKHLPAVLERRSLAVQEQDHKFIRKLLT